MLRRMPAMHLLRAFVLVLGFLSLLPLQVQDASAIGASVVGHTSVVRGTSVVRDCSPRCGIEAKASRSDSGRPAAIAPSAGPSQPDDGFVPIPSIAPRLTITKATASFLVVRADAEAISARRLDRPPKQV